MGIESKITAQWQISTPAEIRLKLGLKPDSTIEWHEESDVVIAEKGSEGLFLNQVLEWRN